MAEEVLNLQAKRKTCDTLIVMKILIKIDHATYPYFLSGQFYQTSAISDDIFNIYNFTISHLLSGN